MATLQFYDKNGQIFPFTGTPEEFQKWNKFGFSLVPNTPESEQKPPINPPTTGGNIPVVPQQQQDPITKFNLAIMDMLKQAQGGAGNEDLYKQQLGLQRAAIGRQAAMTPEELRVLNPSQQAAIRSGNISALEPEIDAISAKIKANDARLQNFESILGQMKGIGEDIVKITPSQDVIDGYVSMIEQGGSPTAVPDEVRNQVISKVDWTKWKSATDTTTQEADKKATDWAIATKIVQDNPDLDEDTLMNKIRQETDLSLSDAESLIASNAAPPDKNYLLMYYLDGRVIDSLTNDEIVKLMDDSGVGFHRSFWQPPSKEYAVARDKLKNDKEVRSKVADYLLSLPADEFPLYLQLGLQSIVK